MKELFEKIYIGGKKDLPKEMPKDKRFIVHLENKIGYRWNLPDKEDDWGDIDWYLKPVEQTPDCYPKEFTEWCIVNGYKCYPDGDYGTCDSDLVFSTLDELFDYWLNNIKEK